MPRSAAWLASLGVVIGSLGASAGAFAVDPIELYQFESKIYSQGGEDGVIKKIFEVIEPTTKYAVEFGAADGISNSNVRNLFEQGWSGLQIEGDPKLFDRMVENYRDFPKVKNLHAWVWPGNIDGTSIQALYELGKQKGYELVHCTTEGINLFFVDRIYFDRFGIADNSPARLYRPPQFGYKRGGRAPNGRGWQRAEAKGPLVYLGGKVEKVFVQPKLYAQPHAQE